MGTPLPEIITERGIECPICPETGSPFPGGPTPKNPVMTFAGFSHGDLWLDIYDKELQAGMEVIQQVDPCVYVGLSTRFAWIWSNEGGLAQPIIHLLDSPFSSAFFSIGAILCKVQYTNQIIDPADVIAFDGQVHLTWGDII